MKNPLSELLKLNNDEKKNLGIIHTASEISNQISLWDDTYQRVKNKIKELNGFISDFLNKKNPYIIFTGAGTSEFIGLCLISLYNNSLNIPCFVCPSPELVVCPENYLLRNHTPLLVSFARSGNSPESTGALKFVNGLSPDTRNIVITCNKDGKLVNEAAKMSYTFPIILSEKTNDMGLAMTSSFTNLLVAGQSIAYYKNLQAYEKKLHTMKELGTAIMDSAAIKAEELSRKSFNRAVFLGSNSNLGTAKESALKLQELTSGQVMCTYDTFLGFRHGPEAVVDKNTLVIGYLSCDKYRARYEIELLNELKSKNLGATIVVLAEKSLKKELSEITEHIIVFEQPEHHGLEDELLPPVLVIFAQLLGLFKSLDLSLQPDNPSKTGAIHRVVKGVKIYDYLRFKDKGEFQIIAER